MRGKFGTSFVFASDEFYLLGGKRVPSAASYEGFPQLENGIGMVRHMLEGWKRARRELPPRLRAPRTVSILCGTLAARVLEEVAAGLERAVEGLSVRVLPVENGFYGPSTNVSGLLVGSDLLTALPRAEGSDLVLIPRVALDNDGRRLLDGVTLSDLRGASPAPLEPAGDIEDVAALILRLDAGERLGRSVLEPRIGGFEFSPVSTSDTFGEVVTYS
jgi:NifB/MoaA-like Fe-S oxidoreductase